MIYLDSCILIYAVEDEGTRGNRVRQRLADLGEEVAAISPLVMLECLVGPYRSADPSLADHYERAFAQFQALEAGTDEHVRAARLCAEYHLRTPDAIHLAVAQLSGCREIWTNDSRLARASHGLAVDLLG